MNATKEKELFEDCPVFMAILRLAFPTVIGQIILVIYNLADTFFIGLRGSDTMLAAVTVCMPAFMFLSAISNLFGIGGASVISRALGCRDRERAKLTASFAVWGCLLTTLVYSLGAWLMRDVFVDLLGGAAPGVHEHAVRYLMCTVVFGGLGTSMSMLLGHLIRAEGRSVQASVGVALGGVCNMLLDPLLMFVVLPRGQEILGAALATALSNLIAAGYFLALALGKKNRDSVLTLRLRRRAFAGDIPRNVMIAGLPACLMTLMENVSYAVLDKLMSLWGMSMQAGIGVAKKVNMLAHCIVRGIAQGALPLIGYNYAAHRFQRMRQSVLLAGLFAIGAATLCMAGNLLFSRPLTELFIRSGSEAVDYGACFLRILCIGSPFSACAYTIISFFQATGKGGKSFLLAMLRKGVIDIPVMFALDRVIPINGIVWATPIADIICCGVALMLAISFLRRHVDAPAPRPASAEWPAPATTH